MGDKIGIKETKDIVEFLASLAKRVIRAGADGYQVKDAWDLGMGIMRDLEFQAELVEAIKGASEVPAEIRDLDVGEGVELGQIVVETIIEEFKAKAEKEAHDAHMAKVKAGRREILENPDAGSEAAKAAREEDAK